MAQQNGGGHALEKVEEFRQAAPLDGHRAEVDQIFVCHAGGEMVQPWQLDPFDHVGLLLDEQALSLFEICRPIRIAVARIAPRFHVGEAVEAPEVDHLILWPDLGGVVT